MGGKRRWKRKKYSADIEHCKVKQQCKGHIYMDSESFPSTVIDNLEWCFRKTYTYQAPNREQWQFGIDDLFPNQEWQDAELMLLKARLNEVKSQLSDLDITTWHAHTSAMNKGGDIVNTVRTTINPELCTQAWCKFYEIISYFLLVDSLGKNIDDSQDLRSLHLCEAPGAFIASLNHYIKSTGKPMTWQWLANTLNPHYEGNKQSEMIAEDRFIIQTQSNWQFGPDNTGDIMSKENVKGLSSQFEEHTAKFHLITADGSVDCQDNPAEQETTTSQLHYCELVTALSVLIPGGSLVLKMFTLMEESSISALYILNCVFEKVTVFKPASSKPGNSEVYVVSQVFKGLPQNVMDRLMEGVGKTKLYRTLLKESALPESFRNQHHDCCQTFVDYQLDTIEENRLSFDVSQSADDIEYQDTEKQCCASMFIEKCELRQISYSERLGEHKRQHRGRVSKGSQSYLCRKRHEGSFLQRQQDKQLEWQQRVAEMELFDVQALPCPVILKEDVYNLCQPEQGNNWKIIQGKRLNGVFSSRFCNEQLLSLYVEFLQHRNRMHQEEHSSEHSDLSSILLMVRDSFSSEAPPVIADGDASPLRAHLVALLGSSVIDENRVEEHEKKTVLHIVETTTAAEEHLELSNQQKFINCLKLFQKMKAGDCLLLQSSILLTRINVGLVYVFHLMFEDVRVFIPENMTDQWVYVLCTRYLACSEQKQSSEAQDEIISKESPVAISSALSASHCSEVPQQITEVTHSGENEVVPYMEDSNGSDSQVLRECGDCTKEAQLSNITHMKTPCYSQTSNTKDSGDISHISLKTYLADVCSKCVLLDEKSDTQVLEFVPMKCLYEREFYENLCMLNDTLLQLRINHFIRTHQSNVT